MHITGSWQGFAANYGDAKRLVGDMTGASQELLHVHAGLLIFVVASLILRKKLRSPIPLTLVAIFALLNEVVDWMNGPPANSLEPFWDFANTVFWPCILFVLARRWR